MPSPVERISAVTLRVVNLTQSVRFTRMFWAWNLYDGEGMGFSSLRARNEQSAILNLEQADAVTQWGRLIFTQTVFGCWKPLT